MAAQIEAVAEFQKTFQLLFQKRNWMLAVPILIGGLVAGLVVGIGVFVAFGSLIAGGGLAGAMTGGGEGRGAGGMAALLFSGVGLVFIVALAIAVILGAFSAVWAYCAGEPVWSGADPDIGGGFSKAMTKLPAIAVLGLIFALVILLAWTFIVPLVVGLFFAIFGLYTVPFIVQGNQSAFGAISASMKLTQANFQTTLMLLLGLIVVGVACGIVNAILGIIPILGALVALAVAALAQGFSILAVWRFYNLLTGAAAPTAPATPTT
jgi:hypothetical protein